MDKPETLTTKETVAILGVSATTLRNWEASGKIKAIRINGKRQYYKDDVYDINMEGFSKRNKIDRPLVIDGLLDNQRSIKLVDIGDIVEYPYYVPTLQDTPIFKTFARMEEIKITTGVVVDGIAYTVNSPLDDTLKKHSVNIVNSDDTCTLTISRGSDLIRSISISDSSGNSVPFETVVNNCYDAYEMLQNNDERCMLTRCKVFPHSTVFVTPLSTASLTASTIILRLDSKALEGELSLHLELAIMSRALLIDLIYNKVEFIAEFEDGIRTFYTLEDGTLR